MNLNYVDASTGRTPLLLLCFSNQSADLLELITFLLRGDRVDINTEDRDGLNALLTVCFWYRGRHLLDIVQLMIRFNVDVRCTDRQGWNCLFALASDANGLTFSPNTRLLEVVRLLVDRGLNANARAVTGLNVLVNLTVSLHHHTEFGAMVRFLIAKGLDVEMKNSKGQSALAIVCETINGSERDLIKIVRLLIDCGIDIFAQDNCGFRVVDVLRTRGFKEDSDIIQLILEEGYSILNWSNYSPN